MPSNPSSRTALAQGWCSLSVLHERIQAHVEQALSRHGLSAREYSLLTVLARQHNGKGGHLHMKHVADAVVLSQSATTRLVTRLEDRGLLERFLCPDDKRGIYTDVTKKGQILLEAARPTHDAALHEALADAAGDAQLQPLVKVLEELGTPAPGRGKTKL